MPMGRPVTGPRYTGTLTISCAYGAVSLSSSTCEVLLELGSGEFSMGKSWENHGKPGETTGKCGFYWGNHGKMWILWGKPWENVDLMGIFMGFRAA